MRNTIKILFIVMIIALSVGVLGCGEVPCEHEFSVVDTLTPATCAQEGVAKTICTLCGEESTESIPVDENNHSWQDTEIQKESTCTSVGIMGQVCEYCTETNTYELPINPEKHSYSAEWTNDDDNHWHESSCGHSVISGLGAHEYGDDAICDVCGYGCDHEWEFETISESTCVSQGEYFKHCDNCGVKIRDLLPLNPYKHTFSDEWTTEKDKHWHASTCGHNVRYEEFRHNFDNNSICTICGMECLHDWTEVVTKEPTCLEEGELFKTCEICMAEKKESIPVNVENHTFSNEWISDSRTHWYPSTCGHDVRRGEEEHNFDENSICTLCNMTCMHDWNETVIEESTCIEEGVLYKKCKICNAEREDSLPLNPNKHVFSDKWTSGKETHWHGTTCGHSLKKDEAKHNCEGGAPCSVCGYECVNHVWDKGVFNETTKYTKFACVVCGDTKEEMGLANLPTERVVMNEVPKSEPELLYYTQKIKISRVNGKFINKYEEKTYYNKGSYDLTAPTNRTQFRYIGTLLPTEIYEEGYKYSATSSPNSSFGVAEYNVSNMNMKFYNFIRFMYISTGGKLELGFEYDTSFMYQTPNIGMAIRGRFTVEECADGYITTVDSLKDFLSMKYVGLYNFSQFFSRLSGIKFDVSYIDTEDVTRGVVKGDYVWCDVNMELPLLSMEKDNDFWAYMLANTEAGQKDNMYAY